MKTETLSATTSKLARIIECIQAGIEAWKTAGELLVDLLDGGETLISLCDKINNPNFTPEVLGSFERIGRGQMHHRLMLASYPAARFISRLPYSLQEDAMDELQDLAVLSNGTIDTLKVATHDLSAAQCKQLFEDGGLRSIGAQRVYLEGLAAKEEREKLIAKDKTPYIIGSRGHSIIFRQGVELDRRELLAAIAKLKD